MPGQGDQARWEPPEHRYRYDFNERIHLCECCRAHILPSGSKWSVWFCETCEGRVVALNRAVGSAAIPIGRHSVHANIALPGPTAAAAGRGDPLAGLDLERFTEAVRTLFGRIDRLLAWSRSALAEDLAALGFAGRSEVPLAEYLAAITEAGSTHHELTKEGHFKRLLLQW